MKLRSLRRWPALFVTFFALLAGPVAEAAEDPAVAPSTTRQGEAVAADVVAAGFVDEVSKLCAHASVDAGRSLPDARQCRALADRVDAAVAQILVEYPGPSMSEQRVLAGILATADDLRNIDKRVRKAALARMAGGAAGG